MHVQTLEQTFFNFLILGKSKFNSFNFEHRLKHRRRSSSTSSYRGVVVVKWSACLPSSPTIRVRIPLTFRFFFCRICPGKNESKQKRGQGWTTFKKRKKTSSSGSCLLLRSERLDRKMAPGLGIWNRHRLTFLRRLSWARPYVTFDKTWAEY